jgi:hypothetical protein
VYKWQAWNSRKGMSSQEAMAQYVKELTRRQPDWADHVPPERRKAWAAAELRASPAKRRGVSVEPERQEPSPAPGPPVTPRVRGRGLEEQIARMAAMLETEARRLSALEAVVMANQPPWETASRLLPWASGSAAQPSDSASREGSTEQVAAVSSLCSQLESAVLEQQHVIHVSIRRLRDRLGCLEDRLGVDRDSSEDEGESEEMESIGSAHSNEGGEDADPSSPSALGSPRRRRVRGEGTPSVRLRPADSTFGSSVSAQADAMYSATRGHNPRRALGLLLQAAPPSVRPALVWLWELLAWIGSSWSRVVLTIILLWFLSSWLQRRARALHTLASARWQ